ncbi:MAG: quinone-dependent dihydroorotate dehydrogenase [Bacteroidota bacterium]|nr:quinone-dependent dihydroorotate dehydrogenase [Bacteroidota bacterium]
MYKTVLRPLLFKFDPEIIHHFIVVSLKTIFKIPCTKFIAKKLLSVNDPILETNLFGITFPNPIGFAAGFDKEGLIYNELNYMGFGFVEIGTFTPKGQPGNPQPRLFRLKSDKALINRMGFNNSGAAKAAERIRHNAPKGIIGGNIGKNTSTPNNKAVKDYGIVFEELFDVVDYFVINVSCPNVTNLRELQDKEHLLEIITEIKMRNESKANPKPILLKISPDLNNEQLDDTIDLIKETNLDGIIATNTTTSRDGLKTPAAKIEEIANGGLSGLPLKDRSTEVIQYISEKSNNTIPIIGVGGINTPEDAIEKLEAGADLLQVYTGYIYEGPFMLRKINKATAKWRRKKL